MSEKSGVMAYTIHFKGESPLVMHNRRMADKDDEFAIALKELTSKSKKTSEDYRAMAWIEFQGGLYYDQEMGPYIPAASIRKSLIMGGKNLKLGAKLEKCLSLTEMKHTLKYKGPRTPEKLFEVPGHVLQMMCSSGGRPKTPIVKRTRPCFPVLWEFTATVTVSDLLMSDNDIQDLLPYAGVEGIGDGRSIGFGKYTATIVKAA